MPAEPLRSTISARSGLLLLAASGVGRIASLATFTTFARTLEPDELGRVALVLALAVPLALLASRGFPVMLTRAAAARAEHMDELSKVGLIVDSQMVHALRILAGLTTAGALALSVSGRGSAVPASVACGMLAAASVVVASESGVLNGIGRSATVANLAAGKNLGLLCVVLGLASSGMTVGRALVSTCIFEIGTAALMRRRRRQLIPRSDTLSGWREVLAERDVRQAFGSALVTGLAAWSLPAAVSWSSSLEQVGGFAVAQRWAQIPLFATAALSPAIFPSMIQARQHSYEARRRVVSIAGLIFLGTCVVPAAIMALLATAVLDVSGNSYSGFTSALYLSLAAAVMSSLNTLLGQWTLARDATTLWFVSDVVLASVTVICIGALWSSLDATNASLVLLGSYAVSVSVLAVPAMAQSISRRLIPGGAPNS